MLVTYLFLNIQNSIPHLRALRVGGKIIYRRKRGATKFILQRMRLHWPVRRHGLGANVVGSVGKTVSPGFYA